VERNLEFLRRSGLPMAFKYSAVAFFVLFWKWFYYSPNTFKELRIRETKKQNEAGAFRRPLTLFDLTLSGPSKPSFVTRLDFLQRVFAPYFVYRFLLFPLPFLLLGEAEFWNAVTNLVLADMLANAYGFLIIVTNHAGDDLYQFDTHCAPKSGRFFVRAVVSSTAFTAGSDLVDFFHGYLNYQVEHHLWPDLSMRSYQKAMPRVKDICRRHGVPYVQENVFRRLKKTVDIMVGTTSQPFFPDHLLLAEDD
jgi:fatty acid desaturase